MSAERTPNSANPPQYLGRTSTAPYRSHHARRSYVCPACGETFPVQADRWRCACGHPLDLTPPTPGPVQIDHTLGSLWRYRSALALTEEAPWRSISLGEGGTPLVAANPPPAQGVLGANGDAPPVYLKLDFLMPTLSYKDRGAVVLIAKAAGLGVRHLVADSSGNAGTALAAYAARAGIEAEVFVPGSTSAKKTEQLRAFGATVRQVGGDRTDAAAAALERVEAGGLFYASHVYNPYFLEGTKTFAYEVWEQLGRRLPGTVVLPAGNGTLLLGAALGFAELVAAGEPGPLPRLIAVQSDVCDPVAAAWAGRRADLSRWTTTLAEGIAIPAPPRLRQMVEAVRASSGIFLTVPDQQIGDARAALRSQGIDVEPTAAAVWAAWRSWSPGAVTPTPVVVALTGAGLKAGFDRPEAN